MTSSSDDPWPTRTLDAQKTNAWTATGLIGENSYRRDAATGLSRADWPGAITGRLRPAHAVTGFE